MQKLNPATVVDHPLVSWCEPPTAVNMNDVYDDLLIAIEIEYA